MTPEVADVSDAHFFAGRACSITVRTAQARHDVSSRRAVMQRSLLLNCFSASNARPDTPGHDPSSHAYGRERDESAGSAMCDPSPSQIPVDCLGVCLPIHAAQSCEEDSTKM